MVLVYESGLACQQKSDEKHPKARKFFVYLLTGDKTPKRVSLLRTYLTSTHWLHSPLPAANRTAQHGHSLVPTKEQKVARAFFYSKQTQLGLPTWLKTLTVRFYVSTFLLLMAL